MNRRLPKETLIQNAKIARIRITPKIRAALTAELDRITITHQLAPQSVNLPARAGIEDILIIELRQKTNELSEKLLHWIDRTLPRATIFECKKPDGQVQMVMAHKRPSGADKGRWVIGTYHVGKWYSGARESLPVSTHLSELYSKILRGLLPNTALKGESLEDHLARCETISALEKNREQLESKIAKEQQMNRRVRLNDQLKVAEAALRELKREGEK